VFKNILVPTDGSKLSQKAVREAVAFAKACGAKVVALHVYPTFAGSPYGNFGPSKAIMANSHEREYKDYADKVFAEISKAADAAGVPFDSVLVEGDDVHKQIIGIAGKKRCDLICMASHGRRGLSGVVLGSETQKVLTHSAIPVLVLR